MTNKDHEEIVAANQKADQPSALEAPELMRRSFLASDAAKVGLPPMTREQYFKLLDDNKPLLLLAAKRIGVKDEEAEDFLRQGREFLNLLPHKSDFDDIGLVWVLQMFLDEIAATCSDLSLPLGNVAIGASPFPEINARQMRAFSDDASFFEVTITLMRLCNLVANVMANTIEHYTVDGKPRWRANPYNVKKRLETETWILDEWRRIIKNFATHGHPPSGVGPEPQGAEAKNMRIIMMEAMELWVTAHEVCHHILKHGTDLSTAKDLGPLQEEYQADILGRDILAAIAKRRNTPENDFLVAGIGAALALGATNLVDRAKTVLDTGSDIIPPSVDHPSLAERLAAIQKADNRRYPGHATRWGLQRRAFMDVFDIVWRMLKPDFEEMRRHGLQSFRPSRRSAPNG